MEPLNDDELNALLRRWEAPAAPPALERRIFGRPEPRGWWRWLVAGSVRVPVPVFVTLLVMLSALSYFAARTHPARPAAVRELKFSDFQPVAKLQPRIIRGGKL